MGIWHTSNKTYINKRKLSVSSTKHDYHQVQNTKEAQNQIKTKRKNKYKFDIQGVCTENRDNACSANKTKLQTHSSPTSSLSFKGENTIPCQNKFPSISLDF